MLTIECLGAVRSVTGSSFLVRTGDTRLLVDCGMFQGGKQIERRNWQTRTFRPSEIEHLLLTHAHIDHSGLIPKLVKDGFRGAIITSRETAELCQVMLIDSAHIQEAEAQWQERKMRRQGKKRAAPPLYTIDDARESLTYFRPVEREERMRLSPTMEMRFQNAGHILGSSILELFADGERPVKVVFSGDLGRRGQMIIQDPEVVFDADYLFVESTYGDRLHKSAADSEIELLDAINSAYRQGEKVIIPAFAVERTQELIYILSKLRRRGLLPENIPVYLDSPLAIAVTKIFRRHPQCFDDEMNGLLASGQDPLSLPNLIFTETPEESQEINRVRGPAIIIAGSGMCNAGRIKHHLKHNLWRPGASIVFVGYQAEGTPGRLIVDGAKQIRLFGEPVAVKAKVYTIGGFSAHADQRELIEWMANFRNPNLQVFVIHGEEKASLAFAKTVRDRLHLAARVPTWMETLTLAPVEAAAPAAVAAYAAVAGAAVVAAAAPTFAPEPAMPTAPGLLGTLQTMEARVKRIKDWVLANKLDAEAPDPRNEARLAEINKTLEKLAEKLVYVEKR
jgi:metallo-beta-lactamase family protein